MRGLWGRQQRAVNKPVDIAIGVRGTDFSYPHQIQGDEALSTASTDSTRSGAPSRKACIAGWDMHA
jgi:hypothetical protein